MDADGIQWSILSAFRDDYRQHIASGIKARAGNSLHGGSPRTGGYGHGRAIDITNAEGDARRSGMDRRSRRKYGLHRPMPGNDPAHIQQAGEWKKTRGGDARGARPGSGGWRWTAQAQDQICAALVRWIEVPIVWAASSPSDFRRHRPRAV